MDRRKFLHLVSGLGLGLFGMGHSPYRQWWVYRRLRLFILTSAAEAASYPLGEAVAALLAAELPESRAMAARARDSVDIVKLLASEQLDLALLTAADARAALEGTGPFAEEGPVPLRGLAALGSYLFVCREDFPGPKAYEIARTLAEHGQTLPVPVHALAPATAPVLSIPLHAAALDYYEGRAPTR